MKHQNRRTFLKKTSLGLASIAVLPGLYGKVAASDRLRVAHIGLGGMGNSHMKWFANLPEVEVVALCDVDEKHLGDTLKSLQAIQSNGKEMCIRDRDSLVRFGPAISIEDLVRVENASLILPNKEKKVDAFVAMRPLHKAEIVAL